MDILDTQTTTANSAVVLSDDRQAIVELDPDHPGFRDQAYRKRRNTIAQIAVDYVPGTPVPEAPYTEEEHRVWQVVWENLEPAHKQYACSEYLEHCKLLDIDRQRIPQLQQMSERIQKLSGFRLEPVGGLVHPKVFLSALGDGVFLSTQYIRHHSTPLYTPEPDVVHELIGHAAMLASPSFTELNRLIGQAAKRTSTDEALERLGRIYWFTIEFGVLKEQGQVKAYGAGLLSSAGELSSMADAEIRPLDFAAIERQEYDVTQYQPILFCGESFEQMHGRLKEFLASWNN
jgi:phenylalanine-4-hydroxylase